MVLMKVDFGGQYRLLRESNLHVVAALFWRNSCTRVTFVGTSAVGYARWLEVLATVEKLWCAARARANGIAQYLKVLLIPDNSLNDATQFDQGV
jgi:hypothetical protein